MSRAVAFGKAAAKEFEDAAFWYETQHPGLGTAFVEAVRDAVRLAAERPSRYAVVYRDLRCLRTKRVPYLILFRVETDRIFVIAVFHARRDPAVWRGRA